MSQDKPEMQNSRQIPVELDPETAQGMYINMAMVNHSENEFTLLYEWTHYLTHTRYKPKGKYYRRIWQLHRWHHYKHEGYWFSFTVPYLDGWFGTGPDPKEVERSPTARTLGGDPHEQL